MPDLDTDFYEFKKREKIDFVQVLLMQKEIVLIAENLLNESNP